MSSESMMNVPADLTSRLARLESAVNTDDGFDLPALLRALWHGKWFIGSVTLLVTVIVATLLFLKPNIYRAEVLLIPAASAGSSSLTGSSMPVGGGFASIAALRLGRDKNGDKATYAMELLNTWGFLEKFARDNRIEVPLMAAQGWDRRTGKIIINPKKYDLARQKWLSQSDDRDPEPTGWAIYKSLKNKIDIVQDKNTSVISLKVTHLSPIYAKEWADKLVIAVNTHMQSQDQRDARRNIDYLHKQIDSTALTDMQKIFYSLIEEQTKNLMLAEASDEYVLKTLSPAQTPEVKLGPNRVLDSILAALAGGILGIFIWLAVLYPSRKHRYASPA